MSDPATSPDTCNVISLPESAGGPSPWRLPDGRLIDPCGLAAALVSLSASQVRAMGLQISGISGLHGSTSSASAALQSSLESRLRRRLSTDGSTECVLTWKAKITPLARAYCQLAASMRPISAKDSGLWPTPAARDWRSESASAEFYERWSANPKGKTLPMMLALWATPTSLAPAKNGNNEAGNSAGLVAIRKQALWATLTAVDHARGHTVRPQDTGIPLPQMTAMALGVPPNGYSDTTEKPGALNPQFVCYLMGFPLAWESCAPSVMPSSRKSQRSSSKPMPKPEG